MPITIAVARPDGAEVGLADVELLDEDVSSRQLVKWSEFSGPVGGVVTFTPRETQVALPSEQTTQATFSQPGAYVLLAQVLDGSFSNLCCWTNAYVRVTVQ